MRTKAPRLILQGDTRRAKPWIPWATKWLERLKNVLGTIPINQSNWVVGGDRGVFVHVHSVIGIDTIRIFVKQPVEGCLDSAKFAIDDVTGLTVTVTPDEELCFNNYLWAWGDNQYNFYTGVGVPRTHTYERAGNYNIKLIAYTPDLGSYSQNVDVNYDVSMLGGRYIPFSVTSNAHCHGELLVPPHDIWPPELGNATNSWYGARYSFGFPIWSYWYTRSRMTANLSELAGHPALATGKCFIFQRGWQCAYTGYDDDGASKPEWFYYSGSDVGMTTFDVATQPLSTVVGTLLDNTLPMVDITFGMLDQNATLNQVTPPPILPDPAGMADFDANFRWSGWRQFRTDTMPNPKITLLPYSKKKELTKPVTVA